MSTKTKNNGLKKGEEKIDLDAVRKFIRAAIITLQAQKDKKYADKKGIHVVFSGFNQIFEKHFGFEARELLRPAKNKENLPAGDLIADGSFHAHFVKGGMMLMLPEDAPAAGAGNEAKIEKGLAAILANIK